MFFIFLIITIITSIIVSNSLSSALEVFASGWIRIAIWIGATIICAAIHPILGLIAFVVVGKGLGA